MVVISDNSNYLYFITLQSESYMFFKDLSSINCKYQSDGLYTECGQKELTLSVVKETPYYEDNTIEVIEATSSSDTEEILTDSFDKKLSSNIKTMIIWIVIVSCIVDFPFILVYL